MKVRIFALVSLIVTIIFTITLFNNCSIQMSQEADPAPKFHKVVVVKDGRVDRTKNE